MVQQTQYAMRTWWFNRYRSIDEYQNESKQFGFLWTDFYFHLVLIQARTYSIQAGTFIIIIISFFCTTPLDFGPKVLKNAPKAKHFANDIEYCYYSYYGLICCRPIDGNTIGIQWTETINKNTQMYDVFDP